MLHTSLVESLYLDLNSYFASVEQHDNEALLGWPVAVVPSREISPTATCIAASYEAKALGVKTGTKVGDARTLCPSIEFRSARHDRYVELHHAIKAAVEHILPIEKTCSIDEFACRLTGQQRKLEMALDLARSIKKRISSDVGPSLRCSIGLGPNTLLAKIAGELEKPDGLQWIMPGEQWTKLAPLDLCALPGINRRMERRLREAGVDTVPALLDLAPRHARMIWGGVQGERFLRALWGESIPDLVTKRRMIGHSQVLAPRNRVHTEARIVARRLLVKAASRLRRSGYFASRLTFGAKRIGGGRFRRETSFAATQDTILLLKALETGWRDLQPAERLLTVSVALHGLVAREAHIPDLFEDREAPGVATRRETLFRIVDELNQRYGRDTLTFGEAPKQLAPYTGAKIAFNRVPEEIEFRE